MITWQEENKVFFGLDYSTLKGSWNDFNFDIRYDYDGNYKEKPIDCGLWLTIYFKNKPLKSSCSKDIQFLKKIAEKFLTDLQQQFNSVK